MRLPAAASATVAHVFGISWSVRPMMRWMPPPTSFFRQDPPARHATSSKYATELTAYASVCPSPATPPSQRPIPLFACATSAKRRSCGSATPAPST